MAKHGSRSFGSLAIIAMVGAATAACKPHAATTAARNEIVIGATLPLTGAESRVGGFFKEGYELAFEEVNKAGGLAVGGKKRPLELKLYDDTSTQATAVSLADKLINSDHVDFLLGTYSTALVEAQTTVAEGSKVPYVNGGGAASEIYKRGYRYIFGALSPVELLGTTLMSWIDAQQQAGKLAKPAKIALLWENSAHGKDFKKGVSDFVAQHPGGYEISVDESFELGGKDFSALLGKVKSANTDLFLADAHLPDYITLHKQYLDAGLCHKIVSYGARGSEQQAIDTLGKDNVAYVVSGVWWSPLLADKIPAAQKFVDAFKARYGGRKPEWFQALAYESAHALFTAIHEAGSTDREAVRAKLSALKMDSLLPGGSLEFPADKGGDAQNGFVLQQNQPDGSSPIILPQAVATAAGIAPNPRCTP